MGSPAGQLLKISLLSGILFSTRIAVIQSHHSHVVEIKYWSVNCELDREEGPSLIKNANPILVDEDLQTMKN